MRRLWVVEGGDGEEWYPSSVLWSQDAAEAIQRRLESANRDDRFRVVPYVPEESDG